MHTLYKILEYSYFKIQKLEKSPYRLCIKLWKIFRGTPQSEKPTEQWARDELLVALPDNFLFSEYIKLGKSHLMIAQMIDQHLLT